MSGALKEGILQPGQFGLVDKIDGDWLHLTASYSHSWDKGKLTFTAIPVDGWIANTKLALKEEKADGGRPALVENLPDNFP